MNTIFKITPELERICQIVDSSIVKFLKALPKITFGTYEHEVTAYIKLLHSVRLLESIVELARKDIVYVQAALIIARGVFENLIRTTWILLPNDKFLNEARYVAYLETECEYLERVSKGFGTVTLKEAQLLEQREGVKKFKNDLGRLLMDKGYAIPKLPNVREMLKEINEERKYIYYVILSQYSHFSHHSSNIYQKNLGVYKELAETNNVDLWKFSFGTTLPIFRLASEFFFASLGYTEEIFLDEEKNEFERLIYQK